MTDFRDRSKQISDIIYSSSAFSCLTGEPKAHVDSWEWVGREGSSVEIGEKARSPARMQHSATWRHLITQCRPVDFAKNWFERGAFAVEPVRAVCVAESLGNETWPSLNSGAEIVFDRCRLVEFSEGIAGNLLEQLYAWTIAAKDTVKTDNLKRKVQAKRSKKLKS